MNKREINKFIKAADFQASDAVVKAIAFGGTFCGYSHGVKEVPESMDTWAKVHTAHGTSRADSIPIGYVVTNEVTDKIEAFALDLHDAEAIAEDIEAKTTIGAVVLSRALFESVRPRQVRGVSRAVADAESIDGIKASV